MVKFSAAAKATITGNHAVETDVSLRKIAEEIPHLQK
jgi:hypothetical protein